MKRGKMETKEENFERLISKRDALLKHNLNKELKKAKINLEKEFKESKNPKKIISDEKEDVKIRDKEISEEILDKNIESNFKASKETDNVLEKSSRKENTAKKLGILRKNFWQKKKHNKEKQLPKDKKPFTPDEEILKQEMKIDLDISRKADKEFKKSSEEKVKKEIIKNSREHISRLSRDVNDIAQTISELKKEVKKAVVGQETIIDAFICAILCDGHVLLEGVPGLAKTLIVKTIAEASGCTSSRIQFTVDLLPSDILGITTYTPQKGFETIKGPIFANFVVADEINRSPPKTQSAMIEAMQEKQVTIGKETYKLPYPFFVMANNNPLEVSGVYTLPEAQIDRFLFKLLIDYPGSEEEVRIMEDNMTIKKFESFNIKPVLSPEKIIHMQKVTKEIYVDERIKEYIVRIIDKTRKKDFENGQYIEWGGSPRASIGLYIASKAWALMNGRAYVVPKDVKDIAHYVLRHRVILNYRAKAEKLSSDKVIDEILDMIEV